MLTILGIIAAIIWGAIVGIFRLWDRPGYTSGRPGWLLNPGRGRRDHGAADSILGDATGRRPALDPGNGLDPGLGRRRSRVAADPAL